MFVFLSFQDELRTATSLRVTFSNGIAFKDIIFPSHSSLTSFTCCLSDIAQSFFFWPFTAGGILLSHQFHITFSNIFKDLLFFFLPIGNFINLGTLNINKTPLYLVFFSFLITSGLGFGRISGAANYRSTLVFLFLFYHISANLVFSYPQCCIR